MCHEIDVMTTTGPRYATYIVDIHLSFISAQQMFTGSLILVCRVRYLVTFSNVTDDTFELVPESICMCDNLHTHTHILVCYCCVCVCVCVTVCMSSVSYLSPASPLCCDVSVVGDRVIYSGLMSVSA